MARTSAGILLHRGTAADLEVLLVHPGGPFWSRRDEGAWSIPKGEHGPGEASEEAARREFEEELGLAPPPGEMRALGEVLQGGGKRVTAFALAGDLDPAQVRSNHVEVTWPPRSGRRISVPEIDRAAWFRLEAARSKILAGQRALLDRLAAMLASERDVPAGQPDV